jgi:hypothetical protein
MLNQPKKLLDHVRDDLRLKHYVDNWVNDITRRGAEGVRF